MIRHRSSLAHFLFNRTRYFLFSHTEQISWSIYSELNRPSSLSFSAATLSRKLIYDKLLFTSSSSAFLLALSPLSRYARFRYSVMLSQLFFKQKGQFCYSAFRSANQYLLIGSPLSLKVLSAIKLTVSFIKLAGASKLVFTNISLFNNWTFSNARASLIYEIWFCSWKFKYFRTLAQPLSLFVYNKRAFDAVKAHLNCLNSRGLLSLRNYTPYFVNVSARISSKQTNFMLERLFRTDDSSLEKFKTALFEPQLRFSTTLSSKAAWRNFINVRRASLLIVFVLIKLAILFALSLYKAFVALTTLRALRLLN